MLAILWFLYVLAARWDGTPALTGFRTAEQALSRLPLPPESDRSRALIDALGSLPPEPTWTLPAAPPGMRWASTPRGPIDPSEALQGDWAPETRPHLQAVIHHLESPEVEAAAAKFAALEPGGCRISQSYASALRRAAKLLAARARYHHAGRNDIDAAIEDLRSIFRFSAIACDSGEPLLVMSATACEQLAHHEIMRIAHERGLSAEQARSMRRVIDETLPDRDAFWRQTVNAWIDNTQRVLDLSYSIDSEGNGWLVLSHVDGLIWNTTQAAEPRFGAWNVASVLFNDRGTVDRKLREVHAAFEEAGGMSFQEGRQKLRALEECGPFTLLDGPVYWSSPTRTAEYIFRSHVGHIAYRRATVLGIGLGAYRKARGRYPDRLSQLVGDYVETVPLDPIDELPLRYVPGDERDDFLLYSIGSNMVDDGGTPRPWPPRGGSREPEGDFIFSHTRSHMFICDIGLEKVEQ